MSLTLTLISGQVCSGRIAAGEGRAGAAPTSSLMDSEAETIGTIPELADSARGTATGEELPLIAALLCGDLHEKNDLV